MKMDLQLFAGGHSVTVVKGDNVTTATASSTEDVAKDAEVTLTIAVADGYAPDYEVLTGGVTVNPTTKKFTMGETDVIIIVRAKNTKAYRVLENHTVNINGAKLELIRNVTVVTDDCLRVKTAETNPTVINNQGMIDALLKAGIIEAI